MFKAFSWAATGRVLLTTLIVIMAGYVATQLWTRYELEPWTRDGRVRANIVQVAPDVSGQITHVLVRDNEQVTRGQPLFEIDRAHFELALRQAEASAMVQRATLAQAMKEAQRNTELGKLVAQETREQGQAKVEQLSAGLAQALVLSDGAKLNLERTQIRSAVNGVVTNLDVHTGAYASAGRAVMALVDSDSFYVEGYFEETKLPSIHPGDPVAVTLMGAAKPLFGHVDSIALGIVDRDRSTGANLLPNVNPTFNWIRLAQRVPVRVALDAVPSTVRLVAGQTATVEVRRPTPSLAVKP